MVPSLFGALLFVDFEHHVVLGRVRSLRIDTVMRKPQLGRVKVIHAVAVGADPQATRAVFEEREQLVVTQAGRIVWGMAVVDELLLFGVKPVKASVGPQPDISPCILSDEAHLVIARAGRGLRTAAFGLRTAAFGRRTISGRIAAETFEDALVRVEAIQPAIYVAHPQVAACVFIELDDASGLVDALQIFSIVHVAGDVTRRSIEQVQTCAVGGDPYPAGAILIDELDSLACERGGVCRIMLIMGEGRVMRWRNLRLAGAQIQPVQPLGRADPELSLGVF